MKTWFKNNGLSIAFIILFIISMAGQWLTDARFGFESFQNWQSEFCLFLQL
jgi:hypothetical protein